MNITIFIQLQMMTFEKRQTNRTHYKERNCVIHFRYIVYLFINSKKNMAENGLVGGDDKKQLSYLSLSDRCSR